MSGNKGAKRPTTPKAGSTEDVKVNLNHTITVCNATGKGGDLRARIERAMIGRLQIRYTVQAESTEAGVAKVKALQPGDVLVALLGRGNEGKALEMFRAVTLPGNRRLPDNLPGLVAQKFSRGGGLTIGKLCIISTSQLPPFPDRLAEIGFGNIVAHEVGHAVSPRQIPDWDHSTGGLMTSPIADGETELQFTSAFLSKVP